MEEARRTVQPTASRRVQLADAGNEGATGFLILMPVYSGEPLTRDSENSLSGYIYAPFNAQEFLDSAIERADTADLGVRLYDRSETGGDALAVREVSGDPTRHIEQRVTIANRDFLLVVESDDAQVLAPLSMVTLPDKLEQRV